MPKQTPEQLPEKPEIPEKAAHIHPRLSCILFYLVFALLFSIFIKFTMLPIIKPMYLPLIPNLLNVIFTTLVISYLFSSSLQKRQHWLRLFFKGLSMGILAILVAGLIVYLHQWYGGAHIFQTILIWQDYFVIYGIMVGILGSLIGIWLIPLSGLLAIYYNKRFLHTLLNIQKKSSKEHA